MNNNSADNILKKGDYVKTGAGDNTLVLKIKDGDAILFTGSQFIVAHRIEREGDRAYWAWGEYYYELPDNVFKRNISMEKPKHEDEWELEL